MIKTLLAMLAMGFVLAGCGGKHHDLASVGRQLDAYVNAHDIDGFAGLLADDVVARAPDGSVHTGKDSVRAWMSSMMGGFHVDSRGWSRSGDTLSWMSTVRSESFSHMGVNPIGTNTMAVFSDGKVRYFSAVLDQQTTNKMKFVQFYADVVNGHNIDAIGKYVADDMVEHALTPPDFPKGLEGVKGYFKMILEAYPDLHGTPTVVMGDGNNVLVSATWEGTNKGKFMGKPGTNKTFSWTVADVIRLVDGKAVEHWGWDDMSDRMALARKK